MMTPAESKEAWNEGQRLAIESGESWLESKERERLIKAMPVSEKKRRRFMILVEGVWVDKAGSG